MEHTLALIEKAHEGDKAARDTLAEENMGLVWSMVRRLINLILRLKSVFRRMRFR